MPIGFVQFFKPGRHFLHGYRLEGHDHVISNERRRFLAFNDQRVGRQVKFVDFFYCHAQGSRWGFVEVAHLNGEKKQVFRSVVRRFDGSERIDQPAQVIREQRFPVGGIDTKNKGDEPFADTGMPDTGAQEIFDRLDVFLKSKSFLEVFGGQALDRKSVV